jgi:hypothetical protein
VFSFLSFFSQAFGSSPVKGGFEKIPSIASGNVNSSSSTSRKPSVEKKEESIDFDQFPLSQHKSQQGGRSSVSPVNNLIDLSQMGDNSDEDDDDTQDIKTGDQANKKIMSSAAKRDNFLFPYSSSQKK